MVRRSGTYVEDRFPTSGTKETLPLSIDTLYSQHGEAVVGENGVLRPERKKLEPRTRRQFSTMGQGDADALLQKLGLSPTSDKRFYRIDENGAYMVTFNERVKIPDGHLGIVKPRENLRATGVLLNASYVEPGDNVVDATLFIEDQFGLLAEGTAIADLAVVEGLSR